MTGGEIPHHHHNQQSIIMSKKFVSWRRVSTEKQSRSGLGMEAQKNIIEYFVKAEQGELIADFRECYTGTELSGCTELRNAIDFCKKEGATLVIAKTDRFRNTIEALEVYEELGDGNILFCDLPHTDKFTLTLFFALAEREALLVSIRTKAALDAKRDRREETGGTVSLWGSKTYETKEEAAEARVRVMNKAHENSARSRTAKAKSNPNNISFVEFLELWIAKYGKITRKTDWDKMAAELNMRGKKTSTNMEFNANRARSMYHKVRNWNMAQFV